MCRLDAVYEVVEMPVAYVMRPYVRAMTEQRQAAEDMINLAHDLEDVASKGNDDVLATASALAAVPMASVEAVRAHAGALRATGAPLKEFYKINPNSTYGKTIMDERRLHNTVLVRTAHEFRRATVGKVHVGSTVIGRNLVEVRTRKNAITIRALKYLGAAILANSKVLMLDFVNCLRRHVPNATICYTDTDSLYVYADGVPSYGHLLARFPAAERAHWFNGERAITPGKMKLEKTMTEAVFLKAKTYAVVTGGTECASNKGVSLRQNGHLLTLATYPRRVLETAATVRARAQHAYPEGHGVWRPAHEHRGGHQGGPRRMV